MRRGKPRRRDLLPFRSSMLLMLESATMPSPPRDQSCWMIALPPLPFPPAPDASRAHEVDGVPHDVDVALQKRRQLRLRVFRQRELDFGCTC